jgi:hypothetical protein
LTKATARATIVTLFTFDELLLINFTWMLFCCFIDRPFTCTINWANLSIVKQAAFKGFSAAVLPSNKINNGLSLSIAIRLGTGQDMRACSNWAKLIGQT